MSQLNLTYLTVTDGTTVVAAVIHNTNFGQIQTALNSVDRTNFGPAGIDASNIIPTTVAAATFGGVTAGVGYKFLASAATTTPLTVSGVSGQSSRLFVVSLTSGGTNAFYIDNLGEAVASEGLISTALTTFSVPAGAGGQAFSNGDMLAQENVGTGRYYLGGASKACAISWNFNVSNALEVKDSVNGFTPISAGPYTNASDESLKENVVPMQRGLAELLSLNPVTFDWISTKLPGSGFIAQQVQIVIPEAVSVVDQKSGMLGITDSALTPVVVKAVQDLSAKFDAYVAAHP